ncbi:MAG TPA: CHRD domain-containing protein [Nitrososphaeraceae archaeon]|nr:CHRD domain-containing protein [Nitrososphaeraceae archaeon]
MKKPTASNKTTLFIIIISLSLIITTILTSITYTSSGISSVFAVQQKFIAQLFGNEQVPPVQTSAAGMASFKPVQDNLWFEVDVTDMKGITVVHIHSGKQGQNGPPIVTLYKGDTPSQQVHGLIAQGSFNSDTFHGPIVGKSLSDLITAIENGETYVDIHTQQNPDGELRGQIMM